MSAARTMLPLERQIVAPGTASTISRDRQIAAPLASISALDFRTIEFIAQTSGDVVAVGTRSGVFVLPASGNTWSMLGNALPDVLVFDLRYQPSNQTLYAGTLGRGVWSYSLAVDTLFANGFE